MNILILGASSAIAKATARLYAEQGASFFLAGRSQARLEELAADLKVRGAIRAEHGCLDFLEEDKHGELISRASASLGRLDLVLICHGSLPNRDQCEDDYQQAKRELAVNGTSVISLITHLLPTLKAQQHGILAVVTSVAGDRGRQPNYLYGAAKSMVSTYLQGLRGRLLPFGVHVLDIRPGLVDSPMTAAFEKGPALVYTGAGGRQDHQGSRPQAPHRVCSGLLAPDHGRGKGDSRRPVQTAQILICMRLSLLCLNPVPKQFSMLTSTAL